jgi:hypothetical protein
MNAQAPTGVLERPAPILLAGFDLLEQLSRDGWEIALMPGPRRLRLRARRGDNDDLIVDGLTVQAMAPRLARLCESA